MISRSFAIRPPEGRSEGRRLRHLVYLVVEDIPPSQAPELRRLQTWAAEKVKTPPDFWVGPEEDPQMQRWYVVPRSDEQNVFLHVFRKDDAVFHDHPYGSASIILDGQYRENFIDGSSVDVRAGQTVVRDALIPHRIGIIAGPATSLFVTGPKYRDWGFIEAGKWRSAKDDPFYATTRHWRV